MIKLLCIPKHCEKEREMMMRGGGRVISDMDKVDNNEDDNKTAAGRWAPHSLYSMSVTLDTSQSPKG